MLLRIAGLLLRISRLRRIGRLSGRICGLLKRILRLLCRVAGLLRAIASLLGRIGRLLGWICRLLTVLLRIWWQVQLEVLWCIRWRASGGWVEGNLHIHGIGQSGRWTGIRCRPLHRCHSSLINACRSG